MDWRLILIILGSLITLSAVIPYIIEIIKGTTKPRVVSWFVWTVLTGLGTAAAIAEGQWLTSILLGTAAFETLLVVILGFRHGDRRFERLDIVCLVGAVVGIILWQLFDSPAIGALAAVTLDLVGGIPTLVHSWKKPHEETWITFFISAVGSSLALFVITDWRVTASAYPIYLVTINALFTVVLLTRGKVVPKEI